MAANKFATMVHRNTNKLTLILIYAVLEWTLIVLLLLNSLFSYLIIKFSEYFGLKPPCLWCSRVDHIFEPGNKNKKNMHRDLLCEVHAAEVSKLGYCSNHHKLAESQDMCEDCLSSRPDLSEEKTRNLALFPWVKELGMIQSLGDKKVIENGGGDVNLKCSCCGVNLDSHVYSPYILIKPSWDVLGYSKKNMSLISEVGKDDSVHEDGMLDRCGSDVSAQQWEFGLDSVIKNEDHQMPPEKEVEDGYFSVSISEKVQEDMGKERENSSTIEESSKMVMKDQSVQVSIGEDASLEVLPQHLEFFFDCTGNRLVPFELIDSATDEDQNVYKTRIKEEEREDQTNVNHQEVNLEHFVPVEGGAKQSKDKTCWELASQEVFSPHRTEQKSKYAAVVLESMEIEEDENSLVFHAKECPSVRKVFDQQKVTDSAQGRGDFGAMATAEHEENNSDFIPVLEDAHQVTTASETDAEVSIGTEIPDLDATDDIQTQDIIFSYDECNPEDPSTSSACCFNLHGTEEEEQKTIELKGLSLEPSEDVALNQSPFSQEINGNEEDKVPDTPTSVDSLNSLHKKLLLLEKKDSGTEESLDGSIISEIEGGDAAMTVERLKSALRNERKTLQALYSELEEERSASAVAANQTMAMINRLQEEKAQMQMEALQYQRMMEEQSEYDQEALQLLNELMVKREKEKQELEKEMEIYRRKVLEYETKEKMRFLRKSKDGSARSGFSSASCSNAEDSDGLSIDLNQEVKEEESFYSHHQECSSNHNTPVDTVLTLEESLADFEEERLSILEQLKVLEEKLMHLDEEDEQRFEDVSPEHHLSEQNGNHVKENGHVNGEANGYSKEVNGKYHQERRIMVSKGKSLLPLFDAAEDEIGDMILNGNGFNDSDSNGLHHDFDIKNLELENKKLDVEEEVDHLYERLQALEADREFLKHCMISLKKGDKGMDLLQEILQHLRDLRNVELRAKNFTDGNTV